MTADRESDGKSSRRRWSFLSECYGATGLIATLSISLLLTMYAFAVEPIAETYELSGSGRSMLLASPFVIAGSGLLIGVILVFVRGWPRRVGWGLIIGVVIPASPWLVILSIYFPAVAAVVVLLFVAAILGFRARRSRLDRAT